MRTRSIAALVLGFALLAGTATSSVAAPITFNFTFATGGATATGSITFESTLLPNPGTSNFALPSPAVLALQVTVSGATSGNGTFGIGSFSSVRFDTHGGTLDLTRQLVGQPTTGSPWGTVAGCPAGGDFNLFGTGPPAPVGVNCFTLSSNGFAGSTMVLTSMAPPSIAAVPALDNGKLMLLALLTGIAGLVFIRRKRRAG